MKVEINSIKERAEKLFIASGIPVNDAKIITDVLLETEMRGVITHGFTRLERYISCLESGGIKKDGNITVELDLPSMATVNGNDNLGIIVSYKAMKLAMEKARNTGVGMVYVKGSHHFGAAGYYSSMCAKENMAGVSMSNGDVLVAATGTCEKTIGNNPFSYSFPAGKYGNVVYDIAMSHTSDQKVIQCEREGKPVPAGWLIDKDGKPTTNASDYMNGGTLTPFGGYKGYGLAMMVEIFAGAMSGAAMTQNVHAWNQNKDKGGNVGHAFMAVDLSKFGNPEDYSKRVENLITEIKESKKAVGVDKVYFPGEIEAEKYEKCKNSGYVEIADFVMESIERLERRLLG